MRKGLSGAKALGVQLMRGGRRNGSEGAVELTTSRSRSTRDA